MGVSTLPQTQFLAGMVVPWAGATAPGGWLLCDGAAVSRTTYAALFAAIGTTYGVGDGTTTFNLPNLKGRVIVGQDAAQVEFDVLGEVGGAKTHILTASQVPGHTHAFGHTHATTAINTRHAHNVYERVRDTGWISHDHTHNYDHWHSGNWANIHWTPDTVHSHSGRGTIGSEGPWHGAQWASPVPINVNGTGAGGTGWVSQNHYHNFNHDHPSTNWNDESPWPGNVNHSHTTNTQSSSTTDAGTGGGTEHNNLQPYLAMNYLIKT